MRRVTGHMGKVGIGHVIAVAVSSALFGIPHSYQGWAGVVATGTIRAFLAPFYLFQPLPAPRLSINSLEAAGA